MLRKYNHFFLFQLKQTIHQTHVFITSYLVHALLLVIPSSETIALLAQKIRAFCSVSIANTICNVSLIYNTVLKSVTALCI
jgi:hypothetical protein